MAALRDIKLEKFADGLARGLNSLSAAQEAGYPQGTSFASNARKRAQRFDVRERVKELRAPGLAANQEKVTASVEWASEKLCEIVNVDLDTWAVKPTDRIAAVKALADLYGWNAPKRAELTGKDGDPLLPILTDAERAKALAALIAKTNARAAQKANPA